MLPKLNPDSAYCTLPRGSADWPQTSAEGIAGIRIEDIPRCGGLPPHAISSLLSLLGRVNMLPVPLLALGTQLG